MADRPQRFYDVEGTYFALRYAEIVTLNVKFLRLEPVEEGVAQDEIVASNAASLDAELQKRASRRQGCD